MQTINEFIETNSILNVWWSKSKRFCLFFRETFDLSGKSLANFEALNILWLFINRFEAETNEIMLKKKSFPSFWLLIRSIKHNRKKKVADESENSLFNWHCEGLITLTKNSVQSLKPIVVFGIECRCSLLIHVAKAERRKTLRLISRHPPAANYAEINSILKFSSVSRTKFTTSKEWKISSTLILKTMISDLFSNDFYEKFYISSSLLTSSMPSWTSSISIPTLPELLQLCA